MEDATDAWAPDANLMPSENARQCVAAAGLSFKTDPVRSEECIHKFVTSSAYLDMVYPDEMLDRAIVNALEAGMPLTIQMKRDDSE